MAQLTDEQIIAIRDQHLPSQGERFDCVAFARAIESAVDQQPLIRELKRAVQNYMDAVRYAQDKDALMAAIRAADDEAKRLVPTRV